MKPETNSELVITPRVQLLSDIEIIVTNVVKNLISQQNKDVKLYSIHQASKILRRTPRTIKNLIAQGILKATPDGKISEYELNKFMGNE
ncbi:MAG TPA: hypothetical protein DCQ31_03150 [Bacteroidales bacterium]|nr:hypothetical protein [Bacteroidales bacterium]